MSSTFMLAASLFALSSLPVAAGELVTNGGFETGDLTGWTPERAVSVGDATTAHTGLHGAVFGSVSSALSQKLQTQAGNFYDVSVWLTIPQNTASFSEFEVDIGFTAVVFDYDPGSFDYTKFEAPHVFIPQTKTDLLISRYGSGGPWYVDDISVTGTPYMSVPEPSVWAMMLAAFAAVGSALRNVRHKVRRIIT